MLVDFETKYKQYSKMIYSLCFVMLKNKEDAEEATQDAFVKLIHKAPVFKSTEIEKAWLIRISINICKDILKSSWKKRRNDTVEINKLETNNVETSIMEEIYELPYKYKAVLYLYYYMGYDTNEISRILGQTPSNIRTQLFRARQMLKLELEGDDE